RRGDGTASRRPRPLRPGADRRTTSKGDPRDVQSHSIRRVVSGALAAASVILVVTVAQPSATAAPVPFLQAPPSGSDALAKYRELAAQAEKLNEDLLKAQNDLTAKQGELDKATNDVNAAKDQGVKAAENQKKYQTEVDKFA